MNIKKYIIIVTAYIFLFVCGFFAPIVYNQSPMAKLVRSLRIKPPVVSQIAQKVSIEIVNSETQVLASDYLAMSGEESSGMIKMLMLNRDLEAKLYETVDMAEYLKNNAYKSQDLVLAPPVSTYDQGLESMISKIILNSDNRIDPGVAKKYARWFVQYSKQYNIHPLLTVAVGWKESRFHTASISNMGATGIMQLMPMTAREVGVKNIHDPEQNIKGGVRYLHNQLNHFHNLQLALAAYNAGPTVIKNTGRCFPLPPSYRQTNYYVPNVEGFLRKQLQSIGIDPRAVSNFHFWFST